MAYPNYMNMLVNDSTKSNLEEEAQYYRKSPNIIFLPCGLTFIRNGQGWTSIGSVVFGWAYATYFVPKIILWPMYNEYQIGLSAVILFYALSMLTIVSLFRASTTDPGRVPFDMNATDVDKINWTHCQRCLVQRPYKSHHCGKCQRCVRKMDHHCHWINNCVAEDNQWLFLLLVLYGALLSIYALCLVVLYFYYFPACVLCDQTSFVHTYSKYFMYFQFIQGLSLVSICSSQLAIQTVNIVLNRTTLEKIINDNKPLHQRQPEEDLPKMETLAAFKEVCGNTFLVCWLNPFRIQRRRPKIYYPQHHV